MSRPPRKAMESIKNYCNKTQCRNCIYGEADAYPERRNYTRCVLVEDIPCDWSFPEGVNNEEDSYQV